MKHIKLPANYALALAVAISVLLATLGNPGNPAPLLAWLALAPLLWALEHFAKTQFQYLVSMGLFGMLWWSMTVSWLIPAAVDFIHMQYHHALLSYTLCCLVLSIPYWLSGFALYYARQLPWPVKVLAQASIITLCVYLFSFILPGNLAHQLYLYPKFIQISAIGGQTSVLFCLLICSAALAQVHRQRLKTTLALALLPVLLSWSYGHWRLNTPTQPETSIRIASIQPNYTDQSQLSDVIAQSQAVLESAQKPIDLLVWPELPSVFSYVESSRQNAAVKQLIKQTQTPILLVSGYIYPEQDQLMHGERRYYNGANLIDTKGHVTASYYKQNLVPFFEYLPFEQHWPKLREIFPGSYRYIAGGEQQAPMDFGSHIKPNIKIAALLCYESLFARTLYQQAQQGANLFINPGNDGWFTNSLGSERHLALALFRSVETHMPWLRVNNAGISIATDAFGQVISHSRTPLQVSASRIIELEVYKRSSFYSQYPHALAMLLVCILLVITGLYSRKKPGGAR